MFNLFDILQNQAGPGMQTIGQQFGLTPDQSLSAMNALLPAIAAGLQHSAASDPMGFGRMLGMAGLDQYRGGAPQQPTQADFLGQLFGSPMLSQAVLQQASSASGIGQQALRQMLPVMAGMVVAGIVHMMINQPPPAPAQHPAPKVPPANVGFSGATFWSDWINQFVGPPGPSASKAAQAATGPAPQAKAPQPKPTPEQPAQLKPPKAAEAEEAPFETFQQMFETGVQVQEHNAKAMQDIFNAFWSPSASPDASRAGSAPNQQGVSSTGATSDPTMPIKDAAKPRSTGRSKAK